MKYLISFYRKKPCLFLRLMLFVRSREIGPGSPDIEIFALFLFFCQIIKRGGGK